MPSEKSAGRPRKTPQALSKQQIMCTALARIREGGAEAVSFRRLADCFSVTPMAIKYHVGSQRGLLAALVEIAFKDTLADIQGNSPAECLRYILSCYCTRALENVNLVRCILNDTSLMGQEIIRITDEIRKNTQLLNDGDPRDVMLNLLVDYTHGFVFSVAAAPPERQPAKDDFLRSIDWILELCPSGDRFSGTGDKETA